MGATEILQALGKGEKLTAVEIGKKLDSPLPSIRQSIKRLTKDISENLKFRPLTPKEKIEKYGHSIGCKIYIYWLSK